MLASPSSRTRDQLDRLRIVVDDQHRERAALRQRVQAQIGQRRRRAPARVIGFCSTAAAPSEKPLLRSATIAMITTGIAPDIGNLLEAVEELPAVHARQHDVQRDQAERLLRRHHQRRFGAGGVQHGEALGLEQHADQVGRLVVVFDHQRDAVRPAARSTGSSASGGGERRLRSRARSGSQTAKRAPSPSRWPRRRCRRAARPAA